jgi:putative methionine-R-sulfoxide reductase with GAF domain
MVEHSSNEEDDDFVPRRPLSGDALLSASSELAVADLLGFIAGDRRGRHHRAVHAADVIRRIGPYRWVGIYDISLEDASVFAWSGVGPPAFVRFPIGPGLTGEAVRTRKTVVANDVSKDSRYLTAFVGTRAEIIVPVLDAAGSRVVGTIDVESDRLNAFGVEDQEILEQCALALAPLWSDT